MQYKTKEEYRKPNKTTNIYIACFTTAHARLKLYELLEILDRRVLYMDTDSVIFIDDGSEECKKVQNLLGECLGQLTNELGIKFITIFTSPSPKDYGFKLNDGTIKMKNKGILCNAESENKIPFSVKVKMARGMIKRPIYLNNKQFRLNKETNKIKVEKQIKKYSMDFNKRMIPPEVSLNVNDNITIGQSPEFKTLISYPYGY
jgi:hypothetical protein